MSALVCGHTYQNEKLEKKNHILHINSNKIKYSKSSSQDLHNVSINLMIFSDSSRLDNKSSDEVPTCKDTYPLHCSL